MSIQRLPNELIEQIVDNIAPDTHLSFALTCKRHLHCAQSMFAHHRECVAKHKEITDIFDNFSRPTDPVAAWHNREFVAYRPFTIVEALQIPTLRSLEVRTLHDRHGRGDFDQSKLPAGLKSTITELYLNGVEKIDEEQLEVLISCFEGLKVLKVERCSFDTGNMLIELIAKCHAKTMEVIHFSKDQSLCQYGEPNPVPKLYNTPHLSGFINLHHLVVELADIYNHAAQSTLHGALCLVFRPSLRYLRIVMTWENGRPNCITGVSGPGIGEVEALDKAIASALRTKAASEPICLRRLNFAWSVVESNRVAFVPYGGHYVS